MVETSYPWLQITNPNVSVTSVTDDSWITTMGLHVLTVFLSLYQMYNSNEKIAPLLPDLVTMLEGINFIIYIHLVSVCVIIRNNIII